MKKWYQWALIRYAILFVLALWVIFGLGRSFDTTTQKTNLTFSTQGIMQFRKGLDIAGGVQLTYKIDFSKYDQIYTNITEREAAKKSAIEIITKNIDKRISALGVSDYSANQQNIGDEKFLVIKIGWVYSMEAAKEIIGKTVELEFKVPVANADKEKYTAERKEFANTLFASIKQTPDQIQTIVQGKEGDDVYARALQENDIDTLPAIYETNKAKLLKAGSGEVIDLGLGIYTPASETADAVEWYTLVMVNSIKETQSNTVDANKFAAIATKNKKEFSILTGVTHNTTTGSVEYDPVKQQLLLNSDILASNFGSTDQWYQVIAMNNITSNEEKAIRATLSTKTLVSGIEVFISKTPQWVVAINPDTKEILNGAFFSYAAPSVNNLGKSVVSITFNDKGKDIFCKLTKNYTNQQMAIFVAGQLMTAPTINEPICGGTAQIDGSFTTETAKELAEWLNEWALPAPLILANEEKVSAALGDGAIQWAIIATALGLVLVLIFLLVMYGVKVGLVGFAVLVAYLVYLLAAFKITDYAFSLSGIAAIILSLGMGIDANILIFERLKEELNAGKSFSAAVDTAYTRSREAIRDGNATTMLIFLVLFGMGMSIFKGFGIAWLVSGVIILWVNVPLTKLLLKLIKKK